MPAAKFPRTAHLFDAGVATGVATSAVTRDDLLWDKRDAAVFWSGLLVALVRTTQNSTRLGGACFHALLLCAGRKG